MAPVSESIDITASPHDVFAYVADLRNLPRWQESVERVAVGAATTEAGTVLAEQRTGVEGSSAFVVAECEPDVLLVLVGVEGDVRPQEALHLEPILEGRGTRVEYAVDDGAHGVQRVARPRNRTRRAIRHDLEHLKHEVEAGAGVPAPPTAWSQGTSTAPAQRPAPDDDAEIAPGTWREKGEGVVPPIRFY